MNVTSREDQAFLNRLTAIVEANLSEEQFGVSELAREFGKSRSYIHRRLKTITNESISQFIRNIRLKRAVKLLETGELTVSEIAYETGFGSPSYFIKCFHEHYGYSPGEYAQKENENSDVQESKVTIGEVIKKNKSFLRRKWLILVFILIIVLAFFASKFLLPINQPNNVEKSIAVLPLQNLGGNDEMQGLADGIMEDIRTRLSHLEGLEVKSKISSEKYRNTNLSAPEIAGELGVSYILEGSLIPDNGTVRINIQLITAKEDKHKWAETFDKDLTGILDFISEVSGEVTERLKLVLSVKEKEGLEKTYTENTEAYQLYLKGRFFWYRRTREDLKNSEYYFKQALQVDPNYSLAWTGLADAYFIMTYWRWIPFDEGLKNSKECAQKSIEIDNNLSETHAVLGGIADWFEFDWEKAERELKLAIELNPNNAVAHQYYAEYLLNRGKFKEAINQCNIAIEIDQNAPAFYAVRSDCFYNEGNYSECLNDNKKTLELNKNYGNAYVRNLRVYIRQKDDFRALSELKTILSLYDPDYVTEELLDEIYSKSGITGIIHWIINWILTKVDDDNSSGLFLNELLIARFYSSFGEWDKVLIYLEKLYLQPYYTTQVPYVKYGIDFKPINNDPRFIELMKKMGLEDL